MLIQIGENSATVTPDGSLGDAASSVGRGQRGTVRHRAGLRMTNTNSCRGIQPILPLTSLRFVAAIMIVFYHGWPMAGLGPVNQQLDHGVSFFFVLSGFILVYRYPRLDSWQSVREFIVARIARIWPLHAITALAAVVLVPEFDAKLIANLAMVQAWVPLMPYHFSYNAISWSISTEFFFYMAFIFLIAGWATSYWWKLLLSAALLWAIMKFVTVFELPGAAPDKISAFGLLYISPFSRLLEFVVGMATCLAFRTIAPKMATVTTNWVFTVLEVASIALAALAIASQPFYAPAAAILPAGSAEYLKHANTWPAFVPVLLIFALSRGTISNVLAAPVMVALGEISYALYLVHYLVFENLVRHFGIGGISGFFEGCLVSLTLAVMLWQLIERPARDAIRRQFAYIGANKSLADFGTAQGGEFHRAKFKI